MSILLMKGFEKLMRAVMEGYPFNDKRNEINNLVDESMNHNTNTYLQSC